MTPPARPWRPAPLIVASGLLHLGVVAAIAIEPRNWPGAVGALVANHAVLTAAGMRPRGKLLGPNWTTLPAPYVAAGGIALTIDDGPDPHVTPRVLDLLDDAGAKASFFCIGDRARRHPALCREIVRRGHAVENHSQHHPLHFALLGLGAIRRELETAQQVLSDITGHLPLFFRAPAGLRNPLLDPVLAGLGLHLASWTRRGFDSRDGRADTVSRRLLEGLGAGDIVLLHDGNAARTPAGTPVILEVLPRLLAAISAADLRPVTLRSTVGG